MTLWQKHGELLPDRLGQYLDVGNEDALVRLFNGVDTLPGYSTQRIQESLAGARTYLPGASVKNLLIVNPKLGSPIKVMGRPYHLFDAAHLRDLVGLSYGSPSQPVIVDYMFNLKQLNRPGTGRICWAACQEVID